MPHSEKVDVFELTDCQYEPEYLYLLEIDDMLDGRQTSILLNIIFPYITKMLQTCKGIVMIRKYPGSDDNGGCDIASEDMGCYRK